MKYFPCERGGAAATLSGDLRVPLPEGSQVEVVVLADEDDEFPDLLNAAAATMASPDLRRATKVTLGVVGGAVAATAASAAVSAVRRQGET